MPISQDIIETIRNRISISSLVSRYLPIVSKSGKSWVVCPFHEDKNPSMLLNDERGTFYCFGCQTKGGIFEFLMFYEHLTFYQAVEKLANECHIALKPETAQDKHARTMREQLHDIHTILAAEFMYQLTEPNQHARAALEYLERRGIREDIRKRFLIGYAPGNARFIRDFLEKRGFQEDLMFSSGLFSSEKKFPLFYDRLVFPILDLQGKPIAFSGRTLRKDANTPKYINSSETAIFKKGEILYGMHQALDSIRKTKSCIVVEGNFDVLSLHALGFSNAVAACGTGFTSMHIELIKRYASRIVLFFDSDSAGRAETVKAIYGAYEKGLRCVVAELRGFKDASEALEAGQRGVDAIESAIGRDALNPEEFLFNSFSASRDSDSISFKGDLIGDFSKFCKLLGPVERYELARFLAQRLSLPEKMVDASLSEKVAELESSARVAAAPVVASAGLAAGLTDKAPHAGRAGRPDLADGAGMGDNPRFETDLMKMLIVRREHFSDEVMSFVGYSDLRNPNSRLMFHCLANSKSASGDDASFLASIESEDERKCISDVIVRYGPVYRKYDEDDISRMMDSAVKRIIRGRIRDESRNLSALSRVDAGDSVLSEKNKKLAELSALNRSISGDASGN